MTFVISGCRDTEIRTYEVPREIRSTAATTDPEAPGPEMVWVRPSEWTEKATTGFRAASFSAGESVDISITVFKDDAGGLVANVNRWRAQIGLQAVDEAELDQLAEAILIADRPGILIDMSGADGNRRIVGAIVRIEDKTWFFKMTGPIDDVKQETVRFRELVDSFHDHSAHGPDAPP